MKARKSGIVWFIIFFILYLSFVDFWQWNSITPMIFGWIPWHVFYQVLLNIALSIAFTLFAIYYWPKEPD
ncbi:hypothetical protein [Desulfoscipio gibsoniae]|uniref:Solute:sodium symporter small subunit n=1 Tax=Desulfoscipio gibsoniae DSM 7213 TaxID=767817 RepID=R4KHT5_9FIRM|nr:hypothetical protein [Desulfoscipio gibsoniae]AGL00065.1 hypothetical protein Desgi_0497 [Desulfoscipio gibsoniae DSM 7213]